MKNTVSMGRKGTRLRLIEHRVRPIAAPPHRGFGTAIPRLLLREHPRGSVNRQ